MSFLDSQNDAAEEAGPPATAPTPGGPPPAGGAPPGGGPILAALASRQRPGPRVSAPGPGDQANSMTLLMQAVGMIQHALPGLTPGTPMHQDALRAVTRLSRHIPAGQPSAGVQRTQLQDLLQSLIKNSLLSRIMSQQQQRPGGAGGPSPQPGGPAPMPSTPLPGA